MPDPQPLATLRYVSTHRYLRRIWALIILLWKKRGFWLRGVLCYLIGLVVLWTGDLQQFDFRFMIRGNQKLSDKIAIVTISQQEAAFFSEQKFRSILPVREVTDFTDSFYWHKPTWHKLLQKFLDNGVRAVGVTLFFGENIGKVKLTTEEKKVFSNSRVVWSAAVTSENHILQPRFSNPYGDNVGIGEVVSSADRVVRYFRIRTKDVNHLSVAAIQSSQLNIENAAFLLFQDTQSINFRGRKGHFPTYTLTQILSGEINSKQLDGKIVFIGAKNLPGHEFYTPLGIMNRAEIFANISENILANQWIKHLPLLAYSLVLLLLLAPTIWLVMSYPQGVALFIFFWLGTVVAAMSAWFFDQYYFWIPSLAPLVQLSSIWVVFVGYQGILAERRNWVLQQEQQILRELEQLKNNFVSLISHDLKTPIAKIQAMADLLINRPNQDSADSEKFQVIRSSAEELNKYIKSIINILRVESRQVKLRHDVTDINELIEDSVKRLQVLAKQKKISLNVSLEPMFSVEIDPTLIQEVINNLIENAIKYTDDGGRIDVSSHEIESHVVVEVEDSGMGIPENELHKVWQKFVRGAGQEHKTRGTGLGLYLVKYFIELHGGEVFISSEVGVGTQIGFKLPVSADS